MADEPLKRPTSQEGSMRAYHTSVSGYWSLGFELTCASFSVLSVVPWWRSPTCTRSSAYVSKRPYPPCLMHHTKTEKAKSLPKNCWIGERGKSSNDTLSLNVIVAIGNLGCSFSSRHRLLCDSALSDILRDFPCRKLARYR
jgi:hypothetical protein